jgi:hypothetical protein
MAPSRPGTADYGLRSADRRRQRLPAGHRVGAQPGPVRAGKAPPPTLNDASGDLDQTLLRFAVSGMPTKAPVRAVSSL